MSKTEMIRDFIGRLNQIKADRKNQKTNQKSSQEKLDVLLSKKTGFMITEAYKILRTNVIFTVSNIESKCKKIMITSSSPGEGKTTTCLNLAITFAQTGAKVLLVDSDLRKPRVYRHLGLERKNGLSDILCGLLAVDDAIKKCEEYKIDCITAGQIPPNPVELLSSTKMADVLNELSDKYDYIFIDTPPVTVVADVSAMAKYTDGVIVVARQNYTIHETLEKTRSALEFADAKILGIILNDVSSVATRYNPYKKYTYSYGMGAMRKGYGYGYYETYTNNEQFKIDNDGKEPNQDEKFIGVDAEYDEERRREAEMIEEFEDQERLRRKEAKNKRKNKKN